MKQQLSHPAVRSWLAALMSAEVARSIDRLCQLPDVRHIAVMPDVHLANEVCVGAVTATQRLIYPAAIGSDIGCGMASIRFDGGAELLADERAAARVLAGMYRQIPAIKHATAAAPAKLPECLQALTLSDARLEKLKARDARFQFGTLGRGNHSVELQADEQHQLWLTVHSGSRGMGQAITAHHLRKAGEGGQAGKPVSLDAESGAGQAYLADVTWAIAYADQNRLAIVAAVERLLAELFGVAAHRDSLIHAHHNHVRRETHFGEVFWVHRKGALSANVDEAGIIPGSMGTASFHVRGRGAAESLCSSSHGGGRELRRGEASKKISVRQIEQEMQGIWFDHRHTAKLRDEAPSAYKDIHRVMRAQRELTRIERRLRPLVSFKGV